MNDRFLADNAQDALANTKRAQEEKRRAMLREQKARDLKQLETQLFYKVQEVQRLKALHERLRREAVTRQSVQMKESREAVNFEHQLKDTETRLVNLEQEVVHTMTEIGEKISKEKMIVMEHQKNIETLERQKREIEGKKGTTKRTLTESFSRLLFFKKKEEKEAQHAKQLLDSNQRQLHEMERSLQTFTQEVKVLENKIRALRGALK